MRTGIVALGVIMALSAAPAHAALDARGELQRTSPTDFNLTVRNTGDVDIGYFTWQSQPGHGYAPRSRPGASCAGLDAGVTCDQLLIEPGRSLTVEFTANSSYPDGAPGFLLVSSPDESQSAGPLPVAFGVAEEPIAGRSALVEPIEGVVLVRARGTRTFVRVSEPTLIPDGSEIDTTRGKMVLTVAARDGETEAATVSKGRAIIDQNRAARPTTTLKLSAALACSRAAVRGSRARRERRLVVSTDDGRIRTKGSYAAATAGGTAWRTTDRCDSTRVDVTEGALKVRDLVQRRTIRISAPKSYTATSKPV